MYEVSRTIMAQYANAPRLCGLIDRMNTAIDPQIIFDRFYDEVWNINTAKGYGLDIWGRIVGLSRMMPVITNLYFGFAEETILFIRPFNQAPFYNGEVNGDGYVTLSDKLYRSLILAKAFSNICSATISDMNRILRFLFGVQTDDYGEPQWTEERQCWVTDNFDMSLTINFTWSPTAFEASILINSEIFPRPAGVLFKYKIIPNYSKLKFFGFSEAKEPRYSPFDVESFF